MPERAERWAACARNRVCDASADLFRDLCRYRGLPRDAGQFRFVRRVHLRRGLFPLAFGRLEMGEGVAHRTDHLIKTCRHPERCGC